MTKPRNAALALLLVAGTTMAAQVENGAIKLTEKEQANCAAEGGCGIYTQAYINTMVKAAYDHGRKVCRSAI